jgi:hypothetical protein
MKDFNFKYSLMTYNDFFDELMKTSSKSKEEELMRAILYEDNFKDRDLDFLLKCRYILRDFNPLKDDLKNRILKLQSRVEEAISEL